jgi:16S rRNA (guanine(966)-N(2))-methyltransferase RsmD
VRIISGSAKGRKLRSFRGDTIRPTTDRVREALFSSLQSRLGTFDNLRVLDLFAGTGALSLEALSRGAAHAILVDQGSQSAGIIADNIKACGMENRARFFRAPVCAFLDRLTDNAPFDLIFLDPPYHQGLIAPVLCGIVENNLLSDDGIICVETACRESLPLDTPGLEMLSRKEYGSTAISFFSLATFRENQS